MLLTFTSPPPPPTCSPSALVMTLPRFLDLAEKTEVNMIFDLLREAVAAAEAASAQASVVDGVEKQQPLPFVNEAG
jgi:hypothetical protein